MKILRFERTAVLFLISAIYPLAAQTQPSSDTAQQLVANTKAVLEAEKTKDAATLKRLVADDFTQIGSEGKIFDKAEVVDAAGEGRLKDYSIYEVRVLPVDESAAIVTYSAIFTASEGDDGLAPRYQTISELWTRQANLWRLKFQQSTPRRPID